MHKDEEKKLDIRVVEKHIQEGSITRAQFNTYLKKLPDMSENIDGEYRCEFFPARKKVQAGSPPSQLEGVAANRKDENGA